MSSFEDVENLIGDLCKKVLEKRNNQDEPFDEFLNEVINECYEAGIHRSDAELILQDRFGNDLHFTEHFQNVWEECEIEAKESVSTIEEEKSSLRSTPCIPDSTYMLLPKLLQSGTSVLPDPRQRDLFLIGSLCTISSVLDGIKGLYGGKVVRPTQFVFVLAPAASGKSAMKYAIQLVEPIHLLKRERSDERQKEYKRLKRVYDLKSRKGKEDPGDEPNEPFAETLFIPGNSSTASMLNLLSGNQGTGLIAETEADSLTNTFGSEWGDFSDILRKAFEHEAIRMSRKGNNEFKEVLNPRFSVCLSGTPNQAMKLIQSAEDGLFSRVNFYAFASEVKWIDPSPANHRTNYTEHFSGLSQSVLEIYHFYKEDRFEFCLQESHWMLHRDHFSDQLKIASTIHGSSVSSVIYRLGLTCYRIAMIISTMEHFENGNQSGNIICSDKAFTAALSICKILQAHAELMFRNLPKSTNSVFDKPNIEEVFFENLPETFSRAEAIKLGLKCKVGQARTLDGILKRWHLTGRLTKPKSGYYEK